MLELTPELDNMTPVQLHAYQAVLLQKLADLDAKEPQNMNSEAFETWGDAHEELEDLIEEAKAEAETLRDEIKNEMLNRNTEEMEAGQYIIRWTSVLSQRFDTTGFKKSHADLYKEFTKQVSSRRFSIA